MRCLYFGANGCCGLYMWTPDLRMMLSPIQYYGNHVHIDANLAPRSKHRTGALCWGGTGVDSLERQRIQDNSEEYPLGHFLRHELDNGYTAIQWWDRNQGDTRGGCNSTILLEGKHSTEEMLAALREHFPWVLKNLERAGVELVEVGIVARDGGADV